MIATIPFVQKTFDRFNNLCFEGGLPPVPIVLTKAGSFLGKMEYKVRRGLFGLASSCYAFRLKISTGFDLPEDELEDVVIHEMIHYYIAFNKLRDTSVHGENFRRIMETINVKYGRHITVRHRGTPDVVRGPKAEARRNTVCVSTFPDGRVGVTVCASTRISELRRLLPRYFKISKMDWYVSYDPFFNRFPRARTPKIYWITTEELSAHLKNAELFS